MKKLLMVLFLILPNLATAGILDGKFTTAQVWDVQYSWSGDTLNARSFNFLYASINYASQTSSAARLTAAQIADASSNGRYFAFFDSTTVTGTYGLALYESDGSLYKIINETGRFSALGDGAIFYLGDGRWGTVITPEEGFSQGDSGTFTAMDKDVTDTDLTNYTYTNTTPLVEGQRATTTTTANAPTALVATAGDGEVSIAFTAPSNNGGAAITDYEYELDDSGTWTSASTAATPVVITGLTNGTAYSIKLRAVNSAGNGAESDAASITPATTANAPTALVATADDGEVSIDFTAPSNTGGAAITDYEYELDDSGTWTSASTAATPVVITGLTNGTAYSIKLRAVNSAGNGAESDAASITPATTANAPTALVATAGDGEVSIAFTAPSNTGGAAITDYEYELDDSGTWTSARTAATPVIITGLTNGTAYSIKLRAVNSAGNGAESNAASITPATTANAPTALVATAGDGEVSIAFTAPSNTGGAAITDYEYELDDSGTWTSARTAATPVIITGLTNGTAYSIKLRAVNSAGNGAESNAASITPATTANAPTALVATAGDGEVSIAFTAPSNTGGAAITDYEYELDDSGTWISASTAATPVVITGLTNGTAYSIKLRAVNSAGNGAESNAVTATTPSPASEFAVKEDAIRSVIANDAQRSLNTTLASNTRLTRKARGRFLTSRTQMQSDGAGLASCNNEALDVDGTAVASADQIATQGTFSAQTGNFEGTQCRLVFGDFAVQRDGDTGSTTATINGKVAWEQMLSEQTMLGYYLGGEVARSNIRGSFTGTQDKYGISVGGYFVHALQENLFLDGFASLGAGRNNVEMADDTLDLTSNYTTQTVTLGAAVSGVIEQAGYNILPELSVAYGKTSIGDVGFTGVAYGLTDDTLSLDAGSVSTATIMFRPEFRIPMDGLAASESSSVFSFAPRLMCERVKVASTTNNCGSGAELGISSSSGDGLTSLNTTIIADRVGNSTRSSLQLNLEHKF